MNTLSVAVFVCAFYGLLISGFTIQKILAEDFVVNGEYGSATKTYYKYDRIDEVKKQCKSVLSSASELRLGVVATTAFNVKEDLNFVSGDWGQDVGHAPIMPFDDREIAKNYLESPLQLASFRVSDVDLAHQANKFTSVSGVLMLGITWDESLAEPYEDGLKFQILPGYSHLTISFQGIYTETKQNGGERVLCLLGNTMLPSRESDANKSPWEWLKGSDPYYNQPPLLQDDQILLVVRYPTTFSLTKRVIRGELKSLNPKTNLKYFDQVHIFSQLPRSVNYEFGADKFVSKACDSYPFRQESFLSSSIDVYKGTEVCQLLEQVSGWEPFMVVPNWRCNATNDFCSKLGPFASDGRIKATNGSFKNVQLYMQDVRCEQTRGLKNSSTSKVAAVFRVARPTGNRSWERRRSALNNMTLAAEGIWKSSNGQLCMVGCLGRVDAEGSSCNTRICMYIPISFSIKQRSIISGSISSMNRNKPSYLPLSFEMLGRVSEYWDYFRYFNSYYKYSKIEAAGAILERNEAFSFGTVIKKSLLPFRKLENADTYMSSLSLLAEDLSFHTYAVPVPLHDPQSRRTNARMQILSVDSLFGRRLMSSKNISIYTTEEERPYVTKAEYTEKQLLLNVSAQLMLFGNAYGNFSTVFLEGLYNPSVGKMYLVGCRVARASWQILFESMDLEGGLDCLLEVVVSYPPTTSRWLVNPTAEISIASQRAEDDPLHFAPVKLQTFPIMYRRQREDILSRRGAEGILSILMLSLAIASVMSQLFYIKHNMDSAPFISLVMLGVQVLGFGLPLITGAEALFKKQASFESDEMLSYNLEKSQWISMIDYTVKLLLLALFLLTLRLCQKVWKSRVRLVSRTPLEPHRAPSDNQVLMATLIIHAIGCALILITHTVKASRPSLQTARLIDSRGQSRALQGWKTELEEYFGLVQDFFLLPQVIGNLVWELNCKPLRGPYFIGITVVRLVPHLYDYIRPPAPASNPYYVEDYEFFNPSKDFYSKIGDIAIPITAILLAAVVYFQQRWNYEKLAQMLSFGPCKLLPLGSRKYERLPSKPAEAELTSSVNGAASDRLDSDDED